MCDVILEDSRDIFLLACQSCHAASSAPIFGTIKPTDLWEDPLAVADQQTRLPTAAIADDDKLLRMRGRRSERSAGARVSIPVGGRGVM